MRNFTKVKLVAGVALLALSPGVAQAVSVLRSYQGDDYSINTSTGLYISACDVENDGHDTSADYQRVGSSTYGSVVDVNGGGCTARALPTKVSQHRAVELVPFGTDAYGPWVYPR